MTDATRTGTARTGTRDDPEPTPPGATPPEVPARSRFTRRMVLLIVVLVVVRIVAIGVLLGSGVEEEDSILGGDARRYEQIDASPGTPYRDFDTEYPPVILTVIKALHAPTTLGTIVRLAISQLVLELATAALLAWGWSRRVGIAYLILGTPMVFFPFPWVRTDLVPVFLVVAGMVALRKNHQVLSGALVGLAVFAKLWPVAMAPVFLVRRQMRAFAAWGLTTAVGLALWVLWAGTSGIEQVFTFRGAKGWQIESGPGIVAHMIDPASAHVEQGAWRTALEVPSLVRLGLTAASGLVVVLAWWWAERTPVDRRGVDVAQFGLAPLAAVTGLLVFASIISPQYVLWILPFAAIVAVDAADTWFGPVIGWLTLAISALTTFGLATIHAMVDGAFYSTGAVLARNLGLVALLVVALVALRDRATTRTCA